MSQHSPVAYAAAPAQHDRLFGHPKGLFLLFMVEMWERFSYYGMRNLLVLYLIESQTRPTRYEFINPGREWSEGAANNLYGWYTGIVYLLPIIGGYIADKLLGTHRSMLLGAILIMCGHIALAVTGIGGLATNELGMTIFIFGLATIVVGTGYFKPCVSTMVGQLYEPGDPRRDGGFSIFYMGINLGAFLCAFVCGTLGQEYGWHYGFGSAAVGMALGLVAYSWGRPYYLRGIGEPPAGKPNMVIPLLLISFVLAAGFAWMYHKGWLGQVDASLNWLAREENRTVGITVLIAVSALIIGSITTFTVIQKPGDRAPTATIFIFMTFNIFFWVAFEQAGSTLNVFAEKNTDLGVPFTSWHFPATWFQSVNAGLIILLAPVFTWLWGALGARRLNPSQPLKIAYGLILVGLGYIPMVIAAQLAARHGALVSPLWLLSLYFVHTLGELCLSPTGLSYVTKAAPTRYVSLLMGIWFISSFVAGLGGGKIASQVERVESGDIKMPWADWLNLGGRADYFMIFVVSSIGAGIVILCLSPILKRMMRDVTD